MNEGGQASGTRILTSWNCPQVPSEFLRRHNQIIRPYEGRINPYFRVSKFYGPLRKSDGGTDKIFEARAMERDETFIRRYLTRELCT